ncbi:MAG: glycoside hydrolase family 15 protein [Actinobacteria bacterium]|nr:glycoside hydrolase family 15 protein [Actinomycetota bacterium]
MTELDRYLPIAEHGLIGDMRTAALVASDGTIDWYCPGRFDAPSVFAALLDRRRGGYWALSPQGDNWTSRQLYLPDTAVLLTRFSSDDGVAEIEDFMPVGGIDGHHGLVRRIHCVRGRMPMVCTFEPRPDYGRGSCRFDLSDQGARCSGDGPTLTLSTARPLERTQAGLRTELTLDDGETATFVLVECDDDEATPAYSEERTRAAFDDTVMFWRRWLDQSRYRGRWQEMVHRSALTLKLLTYAPTGALIAAPTTSLPEQLGGERNWDYRYTWIRDAAFSLYGLLRLGFTDEAAAFMGWLTDRVQASPGGDKPPLQIMYTIDGEADLPEATLDHLEGYQGSAPVRVGNAASDQLQLDIYGELIDSVYLYNKYGSPLFARDWNDLTSMVDWLCDHWDQPDEGIWETRAGRADFTYSRLMSWVAIERGMRVARQRGLPADLRRWGKARDAIYRQIMDRAWNDELRAFTQHYGSQTVDASVLLMPMVKFIAPTDPIWLSTLDAIERVLVSDSLVYRYDPEQAPDGLRGDEGTFSMCTFWYVEALTRAGRVDEARLVFDKMLTYANPIGLYSEEVGPRGELLGNFPQALTHLSLISAAFNLDRALSSRRGSGAE